MSTKERYRFLLDYASDIGVWPAGAIVEFDADTAAWLARDVPGCLVLATEDVDERAVDVPPSDRMQRKRNDRGAQAPIDKTTFKAVRDKDGG